jgi:hypothetical protein
MSRPVVLLLLPVVASTLMITYLAHGIFQRLSPQDPTRIVGLALGSHGAEVRIPHRALDCQSVEPRATSETCRVELAGQPLVVEVTYAQVTRTGFGRCVVTYGQTQLECWANYFALTGGPPRYAAIPVVQPGQAPVTDQWNPTAHVFTYRGPHVELDEETLRALAEQYPIDNYFERNWDALISEVSSWVALLVGGLTYALTRGIAREPRFRIDWFSRRWASVAFATVAASGVLLLMGGVLNLMAMHSGLVD